MTALVILFLLFHHNAAANLTSTELLNLVTIRPCGDHELCLDSTEYRGGFHCQCDPDCSKYGDCCRDSPFFRPETTLSRLCRSVINGETNETFYVSMVGSCPPEWKDPEGCTRAEVLGEDPLATGVPLTDMSRTVPVTYKNSKCAICNNANLSSLQMWGATIKCLKRNKKQPTGSKSVLSKGGKGWSIWEDGVSYSCKDVVPVLPPNLKVKLRHCPYKNSNDFYNSCNLNWRGSIEETLCMSYTAYVFLGKKLYQNAYCAKCRGVDINATNCYPEQHSKSESEKNFTSYGDDLASFQELLDFEFQLNCKNKFEVYDPFTKRCRVLFNVTSERLTQTIVETAPKKTTKECTKFFIANETYELSSDNRSVVIPAFGKTYKEGEFVFTEDNQLALCATTHGGVTGFKAIEGVVTYVGLGISIIFLILHLCAVASVPELRNLSGRTLASLCVALLFGYISFIIAGFLEPEDKPFCAIASVSIYYFFLSAFTWMLVIGFDVWRALVQAVHFQSCRGGQWHRFFAYSAFAWLTPAIMTSLAIGADCAPPDLMNDDLRPGFGLKRCWFSHRTSLAIFFGAPLALVMILNVGFFTSAALMTMGTRPCGMSAGASGAKRDFRMYLRLAVMVGLTWLVGLLANALNYEGLWFAFVVLNTLQGLFIFIMFTCTAKVSRGLQKAMPWTESFRYSLSSIRTRTGTKTQSSSWVAESNDTLHDSAFGSGSEKDHNPELNRFFAKRKRTGI